MKTTVKFFLILFAFAMQVTNVCADDPSPIEMKNTRHDPRTNGNAGPRRGRATVTTLDMDVMLDLENRCLNIYDTEGRTITYYITDEDDFEVASGTISFETEEEATISLANLPEGIYTLVIEYNGNTYAGEFGIED